MAPSQSTLSLLTLLPLGVPTSLPASRGPRLWCPAFPDHCSTSFFQLFIGFGFPYEGPAPLEAIANGCVFLQSRFSPPHSSLNHEFFRGKPTSREVSGKGQGPRPHIRRLQEGTPAVPGRGRWGEGREGTDAGRCLPFAQPGWQGQEKPSVSVPWPGVLPAPLCRELHRQAPCVDCRLQQLRGV